MSGRLLIRTVLGVGALLISVIFVRFLALFMSAVFMFFVLFVLFVFLVFFACRAFLGWRPEEIRKEDI